MPHFIVDSLPRICFLAAPMALFAAADGSARVTALTYDEAYAIVRAEEEARERKLDERYERILNHPDNLSRSEKVDADGNRVIYIRMRPMERVPKKPAAEKPAAPPDPEVLARLKAAAGKPMVSVSLSGEVDAQGISELWWREAGVEHRVFTNANFLYFTGCGNFESETHRYNTFLMITERSPTAAPADGWRPGPDDFTAGRIEYFPVEPEDPDAADYGTLEAMLAHYAAHADGMKTTYGNRKLLSRARKDYLQAHPPKKRPIIFNPRPVYDKGDPRLDP